MSVRRILTWPDPVLAKTAQPVSDVSTPETQKLITDLFDTLYSANGVGLAANQIGATLRVIVIDLDPNNEAKNDPEVLDDLDATGFSGPIALINPKIVSATGDINWEEGCLSLPGITELIKRRQSVTVEAQDRHGKQLSFEARELYAVALQHEIDHLNGRVFVDHISKLKRDLVRKKMERFKEQNDATEEVLD